MTRSLALVFVLLTAGHLRSAEPIDPPLILLSLDGFRWDYPERYSAEAPTLRRLIDEGASAQALISVYPSNTFPNHYSIVTGLYPAKHGIINNDFFDPALGTYFHYNQPQSLHDSRWWGGEPIWVTAIKQGRKAACSFWVGSEAAVSGIRPTFWRNFDANVTFETRLNDLLGWMNLPPETRPAVVAFYIDETNGAGHKYGPNSPEVAAAVRSADGQVATMLSRLRERQIEPNLVVVSDHGMTETSVDRVVVLEDHVDRASVQIDSEGSAMSLRPLNDDGSELLRAFRSVPHVKALRADDLPSHFHFRGTARIAPLWIIPDEGWHVVTRATLHRLQATHRARGFEYLPGDHGFDPALPSMQGILVAHGPAFRRGIRIPALENIHLYNLLCAVLKLTPAKNDGDDRAKALLRD